MRRRWLACLFLCGLVLPARIACAEDDTAAGVSARCVAALGGPPTFGGQEVIDGVACDILEVRLPLGARLTYYVEHESGLPFMAEGRVAPHGRPVRYTRRFGDYREVDGVLFPHEFTYFSGRTREMYVVPVLEIRVNPGLPADRFDLPPELGSGG